MIIPKNHLLAANLEDSHPFSLSYLQSIIW